MSWLIQIDYFEGDDLYEVEVAFEGDHVALGKLLVSNRTWYGNRLSSILVMPMEGE